MGRVSNAVIIGFAGLAAFHLQTFAAIESAVQHTFQLRFVQLAAHAHAEFTRQVVNCPLQRGRQLAIRRDYFEAAVDAGHWADRDEAIACSPWETLEQCLMLGRFRGRSQVLARGAMAQVDLALRDFVAVDHAAVEAQVV